MLKKFNTSDKFLFYVTLLCTVITLVIVALQAQGTYDGGDGVQHYLISRYSFSHPELLLDLWGKPLFTLIASPFAQGGLKGMHFFNIVCGAVSSILAYSIAQRLNFRQAWVLPILVCFTPIYFGVMNSGLTEPLFACALILAIALATDQRYAWAAIVASFLMFIRPEANFVLPVFGLFFLLKKKYLSVLLLSTGFIVYSIVGFFYFHDILWVLNKTPYTDTAAAAYGDVKGELFHYFNHYDEIAGLPLAILFCAGIIYALLRLFPALRKKFSHDNQSKLLAEEYILLYGCLLSIIAGHSLLWGLGLFPTLGMYRYMSSMTPLFALCCLAGLQLVVYFLNRSWVAQFAVTAVLAAWVVVQPFRQSYYPFILNPQEVVIAEAADWLKANETYDKLYYLHPFVVTRFEADPFDKGKVNQLWALDPANPGANLSSGSIIVWDAHFGPNDAGIQLDTLMNSSDLELLRAFKPEYEFTGLGGYSFQVCIFRKK